MISLHRNTFAIIISITLLTILFLIFICIYLYVRRLKRKQTSEVVISEKHLIYSSPASITSNRSIFPLTRLSNTNTIERNIESSPKIIHEIFPQFPLHEIPPNYKTFDLAKRSRQHVSSDPSYASHSLSQSYSFGTIKSKFPKIPTTSSPNSEGISSDSDDIDTESISPNTPSFEYSLIELFHIELTYKLYYSLDDHQLLFEIIRLTPMQILIEQCFSSLICQIRLFINNDKDKTKKYFSKNNPMKELFQFELEQCNINKAYLKLHLLGHQKNNKNLELGQTVLVINQYQHLMIKSEEYTKSIQIYEDRIDMIIRQQAKTENEARALICLVYENDRCLLHIGLIKILGIQYLLKQPISHFHHRDQIQIKISTNIDGKITGKRKSKLIPIMNGSCTFSTSFHFDYVSLHKISICITISYRRSLISSHSKPISIIEFGSTQLKNQQTFQHWTDTLSAPNRPHVHWHILEPISIINENEN